MVANRRWQRTQSFLPPAVCGGSFFSSWGEVPGAHPSEGRLTREPIVRYGEVTESWRDLRPQTDSLWSESCRPALSGAFALLFLVGRRLARTFGFRRLALSAALLRQRQPLLAGAFGLEPPAWVR